MSVVGSLCICKKHWSAASCKKHWSANICDLDAQPCWKCILSNFSAWSSRVCNLCFVANSHALPSGGPESAAEPAQLLTGVLNGVLGEDDCMTAWQAWAQDEADSPAPLQIEEQLIDWLLVCTASD